MVKVNVHEAKTHLSRLLTRVEGGEEVVIARDGRPIARLVPFAAQGRRAPGFARGEIKIGGRLSTRRSLTKSLTLFDEALTRHACLSLVGSG